MTVFANTSVREPRPKLIHNHFGFYPMGVLPREVGMCECAESELCASVLLVRQDFALIEVEGLFFLAGH
jgi:hypothetical protein